MEFRLCGHYVFESIVGARTKAQVFDDQVMDWIVEALHQSHAEEKRFREDAVTRLQEEQSKIHSHRNVSPTV